MGQVVLVLGESGSGKSSSLRNFEAGEIGILSVTGKKMPFKKKLSVINNVDYATIAGALGANQFNSYVIDDANYLMTFELFDKATETGYGKFTTIGKNFYDLLQYSIKETSEDTIVYFFAHIDKNDIDGKMKMKSVGKMLDNQLCIEGLFNIVLFAEAENGKYKFVTQSDGATTAKSPMEMFPLDIDNDLKLVDDAIRDYWGLSARKNIKKQTVKKEEK